MESLPLALRRYYSYVYSRRLDHLTKFTFICSITFTNFCDAEHKSYPTLWGTIVFQGLAVILWAFCFFGATLGLLLSEVSENYPS